MPKKHTSPPPPPPLEEHRWRLPINVNQFRYNRWSHHLPKFISFVCFCRTLKTSRISPPISLNRTEIYRLNGVSNIYQRTRERTIWCLMRRGYSSADEMCKTDKSKSRLISDKSTRLKTIRALFGCCCFCLIFRCHRLSCHIIHVLVKLYPVRPMKCTSIKNNSDSSSSSSNTKNRRKNSMEITI